ncbi:MAG: hypothetical protein ACPGDB_05215, partial [Fusobacterium sp.]
KVAPVNSLELEQEDFLLTERDEALAINARLNTIENKYDAVNNILTTFETVTVPGAIENYNNNATSKTTEFDNHAAVKTTELQNYALSKVDEYNNNHDAKLLIIDGKVTEASNSANTATQKVQEAVLTKGQIENLKTEITAIFDNFDDRFLGTFSTAPAFDNDGEPLKIGSMYYDETDTLLYFYDGGTWEAPEGLTAAYVAQALEHKNAAEAAAVLAAQSQSNAAQSATNAGNSATLASNKAEEAITSAENALESEANALISAEKAELTLSKIAPLIDLSRVESYVDNGIRKLKNYGVGKDITLSAGQMLKCEMDNSPMLSFLKTLGNVFTLSYSFIQDNTLDKIHGRGALNFIFGLSGG